MLIISMPACSKLHLAVVREIHDENLQVRVTFNIPNWKYVDVYRPLPNNQSKHPWPYVRLYEQIP